MNQTSDGLRRIAHDMELAGFEAWPDALLEAAEKVQALENRVLKLEASGQSVGADTQVPLSPPTSQHTARCR